MSISIQDPFHVLGLEATATKTEVRQRYLELVRQHPPERDPERFAEIHDAYQVAGDPIRLWASRLYAPKISDIDDLVDKFEFLPQRLSTAALLRCGQQLSHSNRRVSK